jgi:uncharacterized phiE125 gp8 family phage protein
MAEPITLAQAKAQCRIISDTSEDALLTSYIKAAREWVENYTDHILVRREFVEQRDSFGSYVELHRRPVVTDSVEVGYVDTDGAPQEYTDFVAFTDRFPARVFPERGGSWPSVGQYGGVTVTYTAGHAPGEEPQALLQAMLLLIGHWHTHRATVTMDAANEVPFAVQSLCDQYRAPGL